MDKLLPAPSLIVLVGPSSSGKSTWAAAHFEPREIVSSDDLRAIVGAGETDQSAGGVAFELLDRIVEERTRRKLTTVVDTMGFDGSRRADLIDLGRRHDVPIYAITFPTPLEICLQRNRNRDSPLPQSVLKKQHSRFSKTIPGLEEEGFDGVIEQTPIRTTAPQLVAAAGSEPVSEKAATAHTFGLMISRFDWGELDLADTLVSIATRAENAGFRDLWLMDHFRQIPQVGRAWEDIPEAYSALSYIGAETSTIRLGALVTSITHRHPAVLGKMIATLDALTGGRVNCGLGIGWDSKEHAGYGIPFPSTSQRYELLEETIDVLRLLWGEGTPSFSGRHFEADSLACYPRPVQDRIPITIGGSGETKTLRMVAEHADAASVFGTPDRMAHKMEVLDRHCLDVQRDPAEVERGHLVTVMTAGDTSSLRSQVNHLRSRNTTQEEYLRRNNGGLPTELTGLFERYSQAGAQHSIVALPNVHLEGSIEAFGQVIAAFDTPAG